MEAYKHRLEDLYRLCWMCERRVGRVLETQDATLRRKLRDVAPLPPSPEHSLHDLSDMSCASARMVSLLSSVLGGQHCITSIGRVGVCIGRASEESFCGT